jgi:hypothetical protein
MRGLDLLKLGDELGLAARIAVGVVLQRKLAEGSANLILVCRGRHVEVCIVVSRGIGLDHGDLRRGAEVGISTAPDWYGSTSVIRAVPAFCLHYIGRRRKAAVRCSDDVWPCA